MVEMFSAVFPDFLKCQIQTTKKIHFKKNLGKMMPHFISYDILMLLNIQSWEQVTYLKNKQHQM